MVVTLRKKSCTCGKIYALRNTTRTMTSLSTLYPFKRLGHGDAFLRIGADDTVADVYATAYHAFGRKPIVLVYAGERVHVTDMPFFQVFSPFTHGSEQAFYVVQPKDGKRAYVPPGYRQPSERLFLRDIEAMRKYGGLTRQHWCSTFGR